MTQDESISPIDGLTMQEFESMREQIIEYMKMYRPDGEEIGAYKIMKLFEPFMKPDEDEARQMMRFAWKAAQNAYLLYPDNKHTFSDFWDYSGKKYNELLKAGL